MSDKIKNTRQNGNDTIHNVSPRFSIGVNVCLKSNKYSIGVIVDKARKREGLRYWKVKWDDGEITKVRENTLNMC